MSTKWTKNVKESFYTDNTEENDNEDSEYTSPIAVADYGNDVYIGKDANELILTSDPATVKSSYDASNNQSTKQQNIEKEKKNEKDKDFSSILNDIIELTKKFDKKKLNGIYDKLKGLYEGIVNGAKNSVNGAKGSIATQIASWFHDNFESSEAQKDIEKLSSQISFWFAFIPMSYIIVINWWYVLTYTNFTIDFRDFIFGRLKWIMAPPLNAFELINYYMLTIRMDSNAKLPFIKNPVELMRSFWHWRPIVFSLFHVIVVSIILLFNIPDITLSIMLNGGILFGLATLLSIWYYVKLYELHELFIRPQVTLIGLLLMVVMSIITFLLMFPFIVIICPLYLSYITFLSYMVIIVFQNFWPPSIWSIYKQIFNDLRDAPVSDDNPKTKWGKLKNLAFQQFHGIYLLVIVGTLLIMNIKQALTFSNISLMIFAIIINVFIFTTCTYSAFKVVYDIFMILSDSSKEVPYVSPPEKIIPNNAI